MKTTLNQIRKHEPCTDGWEKLLKHLGKTQADDEPLSLLTILDSNGVDDALWCLRAVEGKDREIRLYAVWCARQVQHLLTDKRSLDALDVAERYANGEATKDELNAAMSAARSARDAAWSARDAAWEAAWYAAWYAAWDAAWEAARDADAWDAAEAAAWDAAWEDARAKQADELRRICEEVEGCEQH